MVQVEKAGLFGEASEGNAQAGTVVHLVQESPPALDAAQRFGGFLETEFALEVW